MSSNQKAIMILLEALIYGVIGVIFGTVLGLGLASLFYNSIASVIMNATEYDLGHFIGSLSTVCISLLCGIGAVALAAFLPIIRMKKLSVLETIKTNNRINISLKQTLMSRLTEKLFGRIGTLAGQNYDNNKERYRAISLALSGGTNFFITVQSLFMWPIWDSLDYGLSIGPDDDI